MQTYIDGLSDYLIERYKLYIETFMIDLGSEAGVIEFRVGYTLRKDHKLRSFVLKVGAGEAVTEDERRAIVDALFLEIEDQLDEAIALDQAELN